MANVFRKIQYKYRPLVQRVPDKRRFLSGFLPISGGFEVQIGQPRAKKKTLKKTKKKQKNKKNKKNGAAGRRKRTKSCYTRNILFISHLYIFVDLVIMDVKEKLALHKEFQRSGLKAGTFARKRGVSFG